MVIAVESLLFLIGGIVLTFVLFQIFGRAPEGSGRRLPPSIRLIRQLQPPAGDEETQLLINGQEILVASSKGLRLADYTAQVERLEALSTRIASALGVSLELARLGLEQGDATRGLPVGQLPGGEAEAGQKE